MINPTMRPGMTEEVCRLLPEGIGLIPLFLNINRGTEDEFEKMMPHYQAQIAVLVAQNHVRALKAVKAKSFVGPTYFPEKLNKIFAQYFIDAGFEVRGMDGIDV